MTCRYDSTDLGKADFVFTPFVEAGRFPVRILAAIELRHLGGVASPRCIPECDRSRIHIKLNLSAPMKEERWN